MIEMLVLLAAVLGSVWYIEDIKWRRIISLSLCASYVILVIGMT